MRKRKFYTKSFIFLLIVTTFFTTSCKDQSETGLVDLSLKFNSKAKTNVSRDISPSNDELTVFRFEVNGSGPNSKTFNIETSESSTQLCDLEKGKWDISVTGYNVNDEAIVEGNGTYYLFNSQSNVNISLDYIVGNGDVDIDLYWNENQVDPERVSIITTYYKLDNNTFSEYTIEDDFIYEDGHANVSTTLPCGNYVLASKLFSGTTELSGFAEELRVISNHTTSGSNTYIIGDTTLDYGISFTCNTHLPIKGVITSLPETIIQGQTMTLTYTPTEIPDGYSESDIRYSWYYEGSLISGESTNILSILPVEGQHRYDMFAYIDGISGTLGSTKIIITCD